MMRLFLCLLCLIASLFGEELFIESTSEGIHKLNVAMLPFGPKPQSSRKPAEDAGAIIGNDLRLSGRFDVFATQGPDTAFFRANNISVFIDGSYSVSGDKITLFCNLRDALSQNVITEKSYEVASANLRRAAHLFSDETVYRLFGEKGFAATRIVCTQKQGQAKKEIVLMDYDGHNQVRLTSNNLLNLTPAWSPDNKGVIYTSYRQGTPALFVTWIYTGKTTRLTQNDRLNFSPSWNGVEDKITFSSSLRGDCQIYVMDADGGNIKQLTFRNNSLESSPDFSPNGYEIAFSSDRTGNPQVYIMDNEGANQRRLTFEGKYNDAPAWSPKGDKIAYQSMEEGGFNIYIINPDGTDAKRLTENSGNNEHPSFSPDGRRIVFSSTRQGGSDLYLMNEDGGDPVRITFSGNLYSPEWSGY